MASLLFLITTVANIYLSSKVYCMKRFATVDKAMSILNLLKSLKEENFEYEHLYAPASDAICLQWTYRDHKVTSIFTEILRNSFFVFAYERIK